MRASDWIGEPVDSLLDVGCNVGAWLGECTGRYPNARLAGTDINENAVAKARARLPGVELHRAGGERLPFPDRTFQYVTCIEVLEHLPANLRAAAFQEMRRVLRPGGRLILTVPHTGWFAWLDSNNLRFRWPGAYRRLIGRGRRDGNYTALAREVEWHHHFSERELLALAGAGWRHVATQRGGLVLFPLMDLLSWPFYRLGRGEHPLRRWFERVAEWDYTIDFARASYGILLVLERVEV